MNKKEFNIVLAVLGFLVVVLGYLNLTIKSEYKEKKANYLEFEKSSYEIFQIKKMQKKSKNLISTLSSIKQPKVTNRSNSTIYVFDNLNTNDLNQLLKKIKGSFLPIKNLEIKRDTTNHAMIALEIVKWKKS